MNLGYEVESEEMESFIVIFEEGGRFEYFSDGLSKCYLYTIETLHFVVRGRGKGICEFSGYIRNKGMT